MTRIHETRECFNLDLFLEARELTITAVKEIKKRTYIGMSEDDGHRIIDQVLEEMGAETKWHPNKFRIGSNTVKSFREISIEGLKLKENDLFFIDIGPVWNGHEGDIGQTFSVNQHDEYEKIISSCQEVFMKTADIWRRDSLTGVELYDFAASLANSLGYTLNTAMKGHRVGDFPHHLFFKGGLIDITETPCDFLWVLEIHLISKNKEFGCFFEDILTRLNFQVP